MITCIDAFKNLNIESQQGGLHISPCCHSPVHATDQIDFVNDIKLLNVRETWQTGKFPNSCNNCKKSEDQFGSSRRHGSNAWYKDNGYYNTDVELIRLDYWTGDLCNLACAICSPANSSAWKSELNFPIEKKKVVVNKFWNNINLTTLKFVHFNGGEPLLSKEHVEFLNAIPNKNLVHINYNTNGTIQPDANLIDLWKQFKLVQLDFSIDDIEDRFEYQRYPAKWQQLVQNLQWFLNNSPHNCMFAVNTTVSILNQHNINNLDNWIASNFYVNKFTDPIGYRKQPCLGLLSTDNKNLLSVKTYLDNIDQRRGTNWRKIFPELIEYLKA